MSFAENLQFLRRQKDITQEQLAEQLEVSRQSVSKWESGQSYPEMEKLLQICSMFHCNMDTLMQGDVRKTFSEDVYDYDRQKNQFSKWVSGGIGLIFFGLFAMMLLNSRGMMEELATVVFFIFLIVAVMILVVMGMQMSRFEEKHPVIEDFYTEEEKERAYQKYTVRIVTGIGLILIGLLVTLFGEAFLEGKKTLDVMPEMIEQADMLFGSAFMLFLTIAVPILVYGGLQKEKYNIEKYNKERNPSPEMKKRNALLGKVCGVIMMLATCIFLFWSFLTNDWEITWVVYPVAGILCGVAAVVLSAGDK